MNDLERAREKRKDKERQSLAFKQEMVTARCWVDAEGKVESVQLITADSAVAPVFTNEQRADVLFDLLWVATREDPEEGEDDTRAHFLAYFNADGRRWYRWSFDALDGKVGWDHGWWYLKNSVRLMRPLFWISFLCYAKPLTPYWPFSRLRKHYPD